MSWREIESVSFSPINSQLLISQHGHPLQQWDINSHQIRPTYDGDYITFSLDRTHCVTWRGGVATVRSTDSGVVITKLQAPSGVFVHCCLSPDGKLMAGSVHCTIYVWHTTSLDPHLTRTFVGHTNIIFSLAFASSLISASLDSSIRFWQFNALSTDPQAGNDLGPTLHHSVPIVSICLQANDNIVVSSDLTGVVKVWDISTGCCKASFHIPVGRVYRSDARMVNDILIFAWCDYPNVYIWDIERGEIHCRVKVPHCFWPKSIKISSDGSKVFLLNHDFIHALSVWTGGVIGVVRLQIGPYHSFTVDGSRVWVHMKGSCIQGWDFDSSGSTPISIHNTPPGGFCLDFIDGHKLGSIGPSRIEDTATGKVVYQLPGRYNKRSQNQWNGRYLAAGYDSGEVLILDFIHMTS